MNAARRAAARAQARTLALFFEATIQGMSALARDANRDELEAGARIALTSWPQSSG